MRKVVDEANSVASQSITADSHVGREAHNLLLINDELRLKALLCQIGPVPSLISAHRHAVEILFGAVVHEDLSMAESEQLWQVGLEVLDHGSESTMLDEPDHELDDAGLHLLLELARDGIREDLHARLGKHSDDFAHGEIVACPQAAQLRGCPSTYAGSTTTSAAIRHAAALRCLARAWHSNGHRPLKSLHSRHRLLDVLHRRTVNAVYCFP